MLKRTDYLTRTYGKPEGFTLAAYERELGGYKTASRVLTTLTREQVVDEAKKANLRGRGGAGFPTGDEVGLRRFEERWAQSRTTWCVNADEVRARVPSRTATLMELDPHRMRRGHRIIACVDAMGVHTSPTSTCADELQVSKARRERAIAGGAWTEAYLRRRYFRQEDGRQRLCAGLLRGLAARARTFAAKSRRCWRLAGRARSG